MAKHSLWKASLPPHPGWQVGSGYDTLGNPLSLFLSKLETLKGRGPLRDSWSHMGDEVQVFELATSVLGAGPGPLLSVQELVVRDSYFYTPFRPWLLPVQEPGTCLFQDLWERILNHCLPNLLGLETAFLTVGRELKGSTLPHPSLASGWLRVKELRQSHL